MNFYILLIFGTAFSASLKRSNRDLIGQNRLGNDIYNFIQGEYLREGMGNEALGTPESQVNQVLSKIVSDMMSKATLNRSLAKEIVKSRKFKNDRKGRKFQSNYRRKFYGRIRH